MVLKKMSHADNLAIETKDRPKPRAVLKLLKKKANSSKLKLPNTKNKKVVRLSPLAVVLVAREDLVSLRQKLKGKKTPLPNNLSNNKSLGMRIDSLESQEHPEKTILTKITLREKTIRLTEAVVEDTHAEANRIKETDGEGTLTETITVLKITNRRTLKRASLVEKEEAEETVEMVNAEEAAVTEVENLIQIKNQRLPKKNDMLSNIHKRV